MKNLRKYKYELILFALLLSLCLIISFFATRENMNVILRDTLFFAFVFDLVAIFFVLRRLWREKWRRGLIITVKRVFSAVARAMLRIFDALNITKGEKTNIISGKTTVEFDFSALWEDTKKRYKTPKWKHMKNDRERLGFLYRKMINDKIKSGEKIHSSDTPSELKEKCENTDCEQRLFCTYIDCRYDERKAIPAEEILDIKSKM